MIGQSYAYAPARQVCTALRGRPIGTLESAVERGRGATRNHYELFGISTNSLRYELLRNIGIRRNSNELLGINMNYYELLIINMNS